MATLRIGVETPRRHRRGRGRRQQPGGPGGDRRRSRNRASRPKDIQTANFSVSPVYDQASFQRPRRSAGHRLPGDEPGGGAGAQSRHAAGAARRHRRQRGQPHRRARLRPRRRHRGRRTRRAGWPCRTRAARPSSSPRRRGCKLGAIRSISETGGGPLPIYDRADARRGGGLRADRARPDDGHGDRADGLGIQPGPAIAAPHILRRRA